MVYKELMINGMRLETITSQNSNSTTSQIISDYIADTSMMNELTAREYHARLRTFEAFLEKKYSQLVENILSNIKNGKQDPYSLLSEYAKYLNQQKISTLTLKQRVVTVKNFLEYHDIDISPRRFKLKVKLPRIIRKNKEALSKEDIVEILNAASDIRIKTYVLLLAATGMRAGEALSVRIKDLDLNSSPARLFVRGQYTKTRTDRTIFLTDEASHQLKSWLDYKYRTRRVCYKDRQDGEKTISEYRSPTKNDTDLIFAVYQDIERPNYLWLYHDFVKSFEMTLDRNGKGAREDGNERRRQITFHSFRRYVKTTISDLGYADYSEYFIGHSGSTYWRKKDSEKAEIFRKIEPYLTFLNIHQLERQGADIQTKVEELEDLNQSLRLRDKVKDDAIAQLSDQLVSLSARLQEIERMQQRYK
jgi:integrase